MSRGKFLNPPSITYRREGHLWETGDSYVRAFGGNVPLKNHPGGEIAYLLYGWVMNNGEPISGCLWKRDNLPPDPHLRGSHVSRILQGDPALGSERNSLHSRCLFALLEPLAVAPYSSSWVWLGHRISHPQEMPPSGPGRDPSTSTPGESVCGMVGWGGRWWNASFSPGQRSGDHLGALTPPTPCWGSAQSSAPSMATSLPLAVQGHESALTAC